MLREEVITEWNNLKEQMLGENFAKEEVDKFLQQEVSKKAILIDSLVKDEIELRNEKSLLCNKVAFILGFLRERELNKAKEAIKEAKEEFVFKKDENSPQQIVTDINLVWLFNMLERIIPFFELNIEEVD